MAEYSRLAKGSFTSTGASKIIALPFTPDRVEITNYTAAAAFTQSLIPGAKWDVSMGNGFAVCDYCQGATPVLTTAVVTTNGITSFSSPSIFGNADPAQQVIGITKASQARVNVTAHGYSVGDTVIFSGLYQTSTTGMPQLQNIFFTIVTVSDADHFDIQWNTNQSNYTALSGSPVGSTVSRLKYVFVYPPNVGVPSAITTGTTTTVTMAHNHNFEVGQEIAFRIPSAWGITQLNSLPNGVTPGSPIYGYVTSVTDNWTFVCNINSTGFTPFNTNQPISTLPAFLLRF